MTWPKITTNLNDLMNIDTLLVSFSCLTSMRRNNLRFNMLYYSPQSHLTFNNNHLTGLNKPITSPKS